MKHFVGAMVGGTISIIALYVVARVAYRAGQEVAREECRYQNLRKESDRMEQAASDSKIIQVDAPKKEDTAIIPHSSSKKNRMDGILKVIGIFSRKSKVLGHLVDDPEDHKIEAFVEGEDIHINVRRRNA